MIYKKNKKNKIIWHRMWTILKKWLISYRCLCEWLLPYIITYYGLFYGDHLVGTTFLYKIVPSVNLQTIHQVNIQFIVYNENNKLMFNLSVVNIHCFWYGYLNRPPDSSDIPTQSQLMRSTQADWTFIRLGITYLLRHYIIVIYFQYILIIFLAWWFVTYLGGTYIC